jgi:hypothetical protein
MDRCQNCDYNLDDIVEDIWNYHGHVGNGSYEGSCPECGTDFIVEVSAMHEVLFDLD